MKRLESLLKTKRYNSFLHPILDKIQFVVQNLFLDYKRLEI